jgi:hypothetical protein
MKKIKLKNRLFNPCKKCIVRAMCKNRCISKDEYVMTQTKIFIVLITVMCGGPVLTLHFILENYELIQKYGEWVWTAHSLGWVVMLLFVCKTAINNIKNQKP